MRGSEWRRGRVAQAREEVVKYFVAETLPIFGRGMKSVTRFPNSQISEWLMERASLDERRAAFYTAAASQAHTYNPELSSTSEVLAEALKEEVTRTEDEFFRGAARPEKVFRLAELKAEVRVFEELLEMVWRKRPDEIRKYYFEVVERMRNDLTVSQRRLISPVEEKAVRFLLEEKDVPMSHSDKKSRFVMAPVDEKARRESVNRIIETDWFEQLRAWARIHRLTGPENKDMSNIRYEALLREVTDESGPYWELVAMLNTRKIDDDRRGRIVELLDRLQELAEGRESPPPIQVDRDAVRQTSKQWDETVEAIREQKRRMNLR